MLAKTYSAALIGLTPIKIEVEVNSVSGIPKLVMIGLPDKAVDEARERITAALLYVGIKLKARRTIVNLAPADIRKTGSAFELAIMMAMLKMYGEVEGNWDEVMWFGELGLNGEVRAIRGALPLVLAAKEMNFKKVVIPRANQKELATITGIEILLVDDLKQLIAWTKGEVELPCLKPQSTKLVVTPSANFLDMAEIKGQWTAKRCLEIAAAGGHNFLMLGPPGSGKSMLAKAMVGILPTLTEAEMIEVTKIYSICGLNQQNLITQRPFRSPHHTISNVGMVGGSTSLKPGEISLAHRGVLFLDEVPEFNREVLEALRQPLEDGTVSIVRAGGSVTFPARLTLVAAANPCPCGFTDHPTKSCVCAPWQTERYQQKLSGPIIDRLDLLLKVPAVDLADLSKIEVGENSATIRARVVKARARQLNRYQQTTILTNSELNSSQVRKYCQLDPATEKFLLQAAEKFGFSARAYFKVIKVAQTIADLDDQPKIGVPQLAEALQYRQASSK